MKRKKRRESDDRPWTEEQWERLMKESDVRSAKYGELLETLMDHPNRDEIIDREMGWDRPVEDDDEDGEAEEGFEVPEDLGDEMSEEEWKEHERRHDEELRAMPAYARAFPFGLRVHDALKKYMETVKGDPGEELGEAYINSLIIAVKLAGGHSMGYDDDSLCGNIVKCKHSLEAANKCLEAMELLKAQRVVPVKVLDPLIAEGKEVRRLVEERIAELRSRVWWDGPRSD